MLTSRTPEARQGGARGSSARSAATASSCRFCVGKETIVFPGFDGGAEWGGSAFDPESGLLYVNANEMAWTAAWRPTCAARAAGSSTCSQCASCHRDDRRGAPPQIPSLVDIGRTPDARASCTRIIRKGAGRMPGFPTLSDEEVDAHRRVT